MPQHGRGLVTSNPVPIEDFARQIQTSPSGILCKITQDVGQLQRPAERFCDDMGSGAGIADPAFAGCVSAGRYDGWVRKNTDAASQRGVTGTPTVLVNNKLISNADAVDPGRGRDNSCHGVNAPDTIVGGDEQVPVRIHRD